MRSAILLRDLCPNAKVSLHWVTVIRFGLCLLGMSCGGEGSGKPMNKQQLAAKIWASANEMRSKIEASEYKDYILGFIFYKFLSEKEETWLREQGFDDDSMPMVTEDDPEVVDFVRKNIGYFIAYEDL